MKNISDLAGSYFIPTHVRDDPEIFRGCTARGGNSKAKGKGAPPQVEGGLKRDILIQYLCTQGRDSIHDTCVVNMETVYYQSKPPRSAWRPLIGRRRSSTYMLV